MLNAEVAPPDGGDSGNYNPGLRTQGEREMLMEGLFMKVQM